MTENINITLLSYSGAGKTWIIDRYVEGKVDDNVNATVDAKDNNSEYVIDSQKEGNTLTIKVTLKENKDKEEFENWLKTIDDNLFGEVLDELSENYADLQELYDGPDYKVVIDSVKAKTNQIVARKIKELEKLLS